MSLPLSDFPAARAKAEALKKFFDFVPDYKANCFSDSYTNQHGVSINIILPRGAGSDLSRIHETTLAGIALNVAVTEWMKKHQGSLAAAVQREMEDLIVTLAKEVAPQAIEILALSNPPT